MTSPKSFVVCEMLQFWIHLSNYVFFRFSSSVWSCLGLLLVGPYVLAAHSWSHLYRVKEARGSASSAFHHVRVAPNRTRHACHRIIFRERRQNGFSYRNTELMLSVQNTLHDGKIWILRVRVWLENEWVVPTSWSWITEPLLVDIPLVATVLTLKWICKKIVTLDGFGVCADPRDHFGKNVTLNKSE